METFAKSEPKDIKIGTIEHLRAYADLCKGNLLSVIKEINNQSGQKAQIKDDWGSADIYIDAFIPVDPLTKYRISLRCDLPEPRQKREDPLLDDADILYIENKASIVTDKGLDDEGFETEQEEFYDLTTGELLYTRTIKRNTGDKCIIQDIGRHYERIEERKGGGKQPYYIKEMTSNGGALEIWGYASESPETTIKHDSKYSNERSTDIAGGQKEAWMIGGNLITGENQLPAIREQTEEVIRDLHKESGIPFYTPHN